MRWTLGAAALLLAALFLPGCRTPKGTIGQPSAYASVRGEIGKITTVQVNGEKKEITVPWDYTWEVKNGIFAYKTSAFKLEALLGGSCYSGPSGLVGSPWAGVRFLHIVNLGFDFGFDRANFSMGIDWLYHGLGIGPSAFVPYMTKESKLGLKGGFLF